VRFSRRSLTLRRNVHQNSAFRLLLTGYLVALLFNCKDGGSKLLRNVSERLSTSMMSEESVFWDIMPCSPLKVTDVSEEHFASIFRDEEELCLLSAQSWFLAWLILRPQKGNDTFRRNVCRFSMGYTVLYLRR
jgi:hypothetical protein